MVDTTLGGLSNALAQRIANIDRLDTLLSVMSAINQLTLCGLFTNQEYIVLSNMLEKTRNYLMTMGQHF